jgi:hypothetical protein
MYRCVATSVEGFVQQVAVSYVGHGYWFYVTGSIPSHKDPATVDRKLIDKYGIERSKWDRARRKRAGLANMQYIRHERFFLLLATSGPHSFFVEEGSNVQDARRVPIRFAGYSISYRGGHPSVRIAREVYSTLKAYLLEQATRSSADALGRTLSGVPFERYAPVRRQLLNLVRAINRQRKTAGLSEIPVDCLRLRRRVVRPFFVEGADNELACLSSVIGEGG